MIYQFLHQHAIAFERVDHPPVFTCEEARRLVPNLDGAETKNLFLRDAKGRRHFLVAVRADKSVALKELGGVLGATGLSFGSAERLSKHLGLAPGSVTLLGVLNDVSSSVEVVIDQELWDSDAFLCHPLVNTSTLRIEKTQLLKFLEITKHSPRILPIPRTT